MSRYGKNMRSCCDSPLQRNQPHILGCDYYEASARVDSPALQSTDEGFESPGGRQSPWNERDAHNRELSGRIHAKRQIIALLQDEIRQLEEQKLT